MSDDKNHDGLIHNNDGPWGKRPNQSPWGKKSNTTGTPDLDEFLQKLGEFFGGKKGGSNGTGTKGPDFDAGRYVVMAIVLVALVWLASGFFRVQPEEDAVILRFGEWNRTKTDPGLGYHLPWPVETVDKLNVEFQRRIEVGFEGNLRRARGSSVSYSGVRDVPEESLMLTGDENIIDIDFVVVWSIKDAREFLYNIRDPESTVKKVAESAMREVIGQTDIQPALTQDRTAIEIRTREIMQTMLDDYKSGVEVQAVQLQKVDPPAAVVDAFNEVQRARADRERLRNEAEAYRNDIIPRARGEAEKLVQDAEGYKEKVINESEGEAGRFNSVYASYLKAQNVTAKRLYLEAMEEMLSKGNVIIMDDSNGGVLPYLPLNELNKQNNKKAGE